MSKSKPRIKRDSNYSIIGSSGSLESYSNQFSEVTEETAQSALMVEDAIRSTKRKIESGFLEMAYKLDIFDQERMYLARGFDSIKEWSKSPEVELSPRVVGDLLRIVREVVPLIERSRGENSSTNILLKAGVSKVRAALPLLNDHKSSELLELLDLAPQMPLKDIQYGVKEARGQIIDIDEQRPVVFIAKVKQGEVFSRMEITSTTGSRTERCGVLTIRNEYLDRWALRFGNLFEIVEQS